MAWLCERVDCKPPTGCTVLGERGFDPSFEEGLGECVGEAVEAVFRLRPCATRDHSSPPLAEKLVCSNRFEVGAGGLSNLES